tara:strand:- start:1672 stop:2019 length:348 start_codon:yes stop_codon:yes gene_type:complete
MGFNSTIVVMNDALHEIANDKDFGANLAAAVQKLSLGPKHVGKHGVDIPAGNHCNAATAVESHHADGIVVVAVGGNCATVLGRSYGNHHNEEDKLDILKQLANELGYGLRKKVSR